MKDKIRSFTDLITWQKGHQFVLDIYKILTNFPNEERFGLSDQIRRASVSITSNIAEGFYRRTAVDKIHFYYLALSSTGEVQNQLVIARDLKYLDKDKFQLLAYQSITIRKLISGLIKSSTTK